MKYIETIYDINSLTLTQLQEMQKELAELQSFVSHVHVGKKQVSHNHISSSTLKVSNVS